MKELLRIRWRHLWRSVNVPDSISDPIFDRLYEAYTERHRGYHGILHLDYSLKILDKVIHMAEHPFELEAALWWHDFVWRFRAFNNEYLSKLAAEKECEIMQMPLFFSVRVGTYIMATAPNSEPTEMDTWLIRDIDHASLGDESWETVCKNTRGFRKEAVGISDDEFVEMRRQGLELLLGRRWIFNTRYFRDNFEARARTNIAREIDQLSNIIRSA